MDFWHALSEIGQDPKALVALAIISIFMGWLVPGRFHNDLKRENAALRATVKELTDAVTKLADKDDAALTALEEIRTLAGRER